MLSDPAHPPKQQLLVCPWPLLLASQKGSPPSALLAAESYLLSIMDLLLWILLLLFFVCFNFIYLF